MLEEAPVRETLHQVTGKVDHFKLGAKQVSQVKKSTICSRDNKLFDGPVHLNNGLSGGQIQGTLQKGRTLAISVGLSIDSIRYEPFVSRKIIEFMVVC